MFVTTLSNKMVTTKKKRISWFRQKFFSFLDVDSSTKVKEISERKRIKMGITKKKKLKLCSLFFDVVDFYLFFWQKSKNDCFGQAIQGNRFHWFLEIATMVSSSKWILMQRMLLTGLDDDNCRLPSRCAKNLLKNS